MAWKTNQIKADLRSYPPYIIMGLHKVGKAQPLYSKVMTPDGEVEIGSLKVGDPILNKSGGVSYVVGVFPQGEKDIFEVVFTDGSRTRCADDHLWAVRTSKMKKLKKGFDRILTTSEIIKSGFKNKRSGVGFTYKYEIPVTDGVEFNYKQVPIDPYLLGFLIGDGCISGSTVSFSTADDYIVEKIQNIVSNGNFNVKKNSIHNCNYNIVKEKGAYINQINQDLLALNLKVNSKDKFIPDVYKYNTKQVRTELLRGLMDSDGHVTKSGGVRFHNTSKTLVDDVKWIVQSLGGIATEHTDNRDGKKTYWLVISFDTLNVFDIPRKRELFKPNKARVFRKFDEINYIGKEECVCIKTSSDDELYLTDEFIVTHNTTLFRDLVLYNYDDETKGLLISFKDEEGYLSLDRLQVETAKEWDAFEDEQTGERGFVQIVDDLVMNRDKYGIEMIALDTFDKMVEVAVDEVFKEHRRLKGQFPKSLNDALGGYGAGQRRVSEMMLTEVNRLRQAGYAVFVLAHTKIKEKIDPMTGEAYEQITNNLQSNFYNTFANIAQMIVNIVVEREIQDGKQIGEKRMMHFRDNGLVDAGTRFKDIPEKLPLSAENFMLAFESGVKNSRYSGKPMSDKEFEQQKKKDIAEREKIATINQQKEISIKQEQSEVKQKKELIDKIQARGMSGLNEAQASAIKKIVTEKKITKITDAENVTLQDLQEIVSIMGL